MPQCLSHNIVNSENEQETLPTKQTKCLIWQFVGLENALSPKIHHLIPKGHDS